MNWEILIGALPTTITLLDHDFHVQRQFNAEGTPLQVAPGDRFFSTFDEYLRQACELNQDIQFESAFRCQETCWYDHHIRLFPQGDGILICSKNITAQKTAETILSREAQVLQHILDNIDGGVLIFNFDTMQIAYANSYLERLYGKPLDKTPVQHFLNKIHPEDLDAVLQYGAAVLGNLGDGEVATREYRVFDKDGAIRWLLTHDVVLTRSANGRVVESLGILVDITERKALEADYARIKRWFDAIMNYSTDAIAISAMAPIYDEIKFIAGNRRMVEMIGYTLEELRTMKPGDLLAGPDRVVRARNKYNVRGQLQSGEGFGRRKDGTIFPFENMIVQVKGDDGNFTEMIVFVRDITERKQREQALIDAQLQAETALKARDIFIANMSHELRSPLNTIQGHVQLMLEQPGLSPDLAESLHLIDFSADHLSRLIGDILDLSRAEAGFDALHPTTIDLRYLVSRLQGMLSIQARRKRLDLSLALDEAVPNQICMDEVKLKQILINVIDNAIKYTGSGTIAVYLYMLNPALLRCVVRDTGAGIPDEHVARLLEPFERGEDTEHLSPGTGLGMAITQRLVTLLGGQLEIVGTPGQGTTVTVDIPFTLVETPESAPADDLFVVADRDYTILVVDDQPTDRQVLVTFLERRGFTVKTADSGMIALEMVKAETPDLIFMDLRMPGMNGLETVKRILANDKTIPIVTLTADVLPENRRALLEAGCVEVIYKPYRLWQISELLAQYMDVKVQHRSQTSNTPETLTLEELELLPEAWLQQMRAICLTADSESALLHIQLIEPEYPETARRLTGMVKHFWTAQVADMIASLQD